ncbi:uncharacterized protein LOC130891251 [Diorhabda carinulata]|uniref:uncharacterized protein LOC130891251 n=1 Tax=Diorhabda carinulata TaxID=1163345 RepID=UPI0025A1CE98|nr:uncharacterized protein LOC130891251 [Diorhabda carinulata]
MLGYYIFILVVYSTFTSSAPTWDTPSPHQYHIQTDEGPERFFRYQTDSGQYRKEKRLEDGTVVGTYAWIDADGMLRQRDYIADNEGYRVLKTKNIFVGRNINVGDAIKSAKKSPASAGTLVKANQKPIVNVPYNSVSFIPTSSPVPPYSYNANIPASSSTSSPITPDQTYISTTTISPLSSTAYTQNGIPTTDPHYLDVDQSIKSTTSSPYSGLSSTGGPVIDITPPTFAKTRYNPFNFSFLNENYIQSTESSGTNQRLYYQLTTPSPININTDRTLYSSNPTTYSPAIFDSPQELDSNSVEYNPYVRQVKDTYRFRNGPTYPLDRNGKPFLGSDNGFSTYDGVSVTNDGFRYYIPRAYHEEQTEPGDKRSGSFGYIDPFGIRRVIYYNTAPGTGFQHRKNNRYVGFNATPYDPRPY